MRINCNVIYDLLPLYVDGACSEESKAVVEEHLAQCEPCRKKHEAMNQLLSIDEFTGHEEALLKDNKEKQQKTHDHAAKKVLKRVKRRWTLSILATLLLLVPVLLLGFNEYRGEGMAYTNLYDHYSAGKFIGAIEKRNYEKAFSYVNVRFYYDDIQKRMAASKTDAINKEDFQFVESEGEAGYYTNGQLNVPAVDFDQWIIDAKQGLADTKEWYAQSPYIGMTYEEFYEVSKANFMKHMKDWDETGYTITGYNKRFADSNGEEGLTQFNYYIYISDGQQTSKSGGITLFGNHKGKFSLSGGFYSRTGDPMVERLLQALSIWE